VKTIHPQPTQQVSSQGNLEIFREAWLVLGVITKAEKNEERVVTYHAKYEDEKEESHLLEKDVEKLCRYAEMDPRPAGPLFLFENFLATENVVVVDRGEAADVTITLLPLSASASEIVESLLSQAQHVLSPKLP